MKPCCFCSKNSQNKNISIEKKKKALFQLNQSRENIWADLIIYSIETYFGRYDSVMRHSRGHSVTMYKILRDVETGSGIPQWKIQAYFAVISLNYSLLWRNSLHAVWSWIFRCSLETPNITIILSKCVSCFFQYPRAMVLSQGFTSW